MPDQVQRYGGLELITHTRIQPGAEFNGSATLQSWSLRWQGQPLEIDTMTGMFADQPTRTRNLHAVYVLGSGDVPDLLVNVGDPNNSGAYHLLHQQDGQLAAPMLCPILAGNSAVIPLGSVDAPLAPPGGFSGPQHLRLAGARWLLLGQRCVFDVAQRRALKVPHWSHDGFTAHPSVATIVPVHDISPDGRSLVRFGILHQEGQDTHLLIVADLESGQLSTLPIDRGRMRYDSHHALDNAWLYQHFEWRRGANGRDKLQPRRNFKPLPRRFLARGEQVTIMRDSLWAGQGGPDTPGQAGDAKLASGRHDTLFEPSQGTP